jgi:hypothetical protein
MRRDAALVVHQGRAIVPPNQGEELMEFAIAVDRQHPAR